LFLIQNFSPNFNALKWSLHCIWYNKSNFFWTYWKMVAST